MIDIEEERKKARDLRKSRQYGEAREIFQKLWEETNDKWDGWGLALCCNQVKDFDAAYETSKSVLEIDPEFQYIKQQLTRSVLQKMKDYDNKGMWDAIIKISDNLVANELSTKDIIINKNGKNITLPSDRKTWYQKKSKALEKLKRWDDCLELTRKALNDFPHEIWLKRRKAISIGKTGDVEKAIEDLKEISLQKTDWFIHRDIAVFYAYNEDYEKALDYIIDGCLVSINQPDPGFRWELYYDAALYLQKKGNIQMSEKHLLLSYSLRDNEGWKTPQDISALANEIGLSLESIEDTKALTKELRSFWEKHKFSKLPKHTGKIKTMLPNGKAGFITSENGKDFYFKIFSFNGNRKRIVSGLGVEFFVQESFDRVKNEKAFQAVNITPKKDA